MSISSRILLLMVSSLIALILIVLIGASQISKIGSNLIVLTEIKIPLIGFVSNVTRDLSDSYNQLDKVFNVGRGFKASGSETALFNQQIESYLLMTKRIKGDLDDIEEIISQSSGKIETAMNGLTPVSFEVRNLQKEFSDFCFISERMINLFILNRVDMAERDLNKLDRQKMQVIKVAKSLNKEISHMIQSLHSESRNEQKETLFYLVAFSILIIFMVVVFCGYVAKSITGPLKDLTACSKNITKGEDLKKIDVKGQDELSLLAQSFNEMLEALLKNKEMIENRRNYISNIIKSLGDLLFVIDGTGLIQTINRNVTDLTGFGDQYLQNKKIKDFLILFPGGAASPGQKENLLHNPELFKLKVSGGEIRDREGMIKTNHGEEIPVLVNASYMEGSSAGEEAFILSVKDARESRLLKELQSSHLQLIQAAKLSSLGTMAAGVAHELNNPLTGIKGFAQLLEREESDQVKKVSLGKIIRSADRMQTIVEHLRSFSRESKDQDWKPVSPKQAAKLAFDLLGGQLKNKGVEVRIHYSDDPCMVSGNLNQLESVFQNLITNSRDAFDQVSDDRRKWINVEFSLRNDGLVEIIYKDNATGISVLNKEKIFDPFFTTKPDGVGTGLGMSISKGIISDHHGAITFESEEGKGTTFMITIPSVLNPQELDDHTGTNYEKNTGKDYELSLQDQYKKAFPENKPALLIIDDEPDICELLETYLCDCFQVETTSHPETGYLLVETKKWDLVLTDLKMNRISGINIVENLKRCQPETPVFIISGHARTDSDLKEALEKGANGLISKPFQNEKEMVNRLIGSVLKVTVASV